MHYNPSISEAPRNQNTPIIHKATAETILGWLERKGRLIAYETDDAGNRIYPPVLPMRQHGQIHTT